MAGGKITRLYKSDEQWRGQLSAIQYHVLREGGTESAFRNEYWDSKADGTYVCAGCGLELFRSKAKFDSGTGWPSFWQPIDESHVELHEDRSLPTVLTEVRCARCGGHLGHVFEDGPPPTNLRYCINSAALRLVPEDGQ